MSKDLLERLQRHSSYEEFLRYERLQRTQEDLRIQLKAPLGREPPLQLIFPDPPWKTSRPRELSQVIELHHRKVSRVRFKRDAWEHVKSVSQLEYSKRKSSRDRSMKSSMDQLPSFPAEVSDTFQFALPGRDSVTNFNPFLRPQAGNHFFPATFFFMDNADYSTEHWPKAGWSRWRGHDDKWEWKECIISAFDPRDQRFTITWKGSNVQKQVSRVNLRFEGESEDAYLRKAAEATHRRDLQEAAFRVEARIEATLPQYPTIQLTQKAVGRILESVKKWLNPVREAKVVGELQEFYRKSVVNFIFEIEHFVMKWQLTIAPWLIGLPPPISLKDRPLILFSKAQKSIKSWLEMRTANHCLLQSYLKQVRKIHDIDLYGFITDRCSASSPVVLKTKYEESVNTAIQSEIEKVVAASLRSLVAALHQTYAIAPMPELSQAILSVIKPEIAMKRSEERRKLEILEEQVAATYMPVGETEYGIRLTKTLASELHTMYQSNRLHEEFAFHGPKAFFSFKLVPRHTKTHPPAAVRGIPTSGESFLPRVLRETRGATSGKVIQSSQSNWILNILAKDDECEEGLGGMAETQQGQMEGLRGSDRLGWVSVGKDEHSLQLDPTIDKFEEQLLELIALPLNTVFKCSKVTSVTGSEIISCRHYKPVLRWAQQQATEVVTYSLYGPLSLVALLRQYDYLLHADQQAILDSIIAGHLGDYGGLNEELKTIVTDMEMIQNRLPDEMQFGAVAVDVRTFKKVVEKNGGRLKECLLEELQMEYSGLLHQSAQMFNSLMQQLRKSPQTVEDLQVITDYLKRSQDAAHFSEITHVLTQAKVVQTALTTHNCSLSLKQLQSTWEAKVWQSELLMARSRAQTRINKVRPGFIEMVAGQSAALLRTLEDIHETLSHFALYDDLKETEERAEKVADIMTTLVASQEEAGKINFRQRVLFVEETEFGDFNVLLERIAKYRSLWTYAQDWLCACEDWTYISFRMINCDQVSAKFSEGLDLLTRLAVEFESQPAALTVTKELQAHMSGFRQWVDLISCMRHPAIRERHLTALLATLGKELSVESLTLDDLIQAKVGAHMNVVRMIYHEALNEYEIEKVLARVEAESRDVHLMLDHDFVFKELPFIEGMDTAEKMVMEQIATLTFVLANSKYASFFRQRIERLKTNLTASIQIMKDVKELQSGWLDLYPLLQLPEIASTLEKDKVKIAELHDFYVRQAESIYVSQSFAVFTEAKIKSHAEANELLESLSKGAEKQIRRLTTAFPRLLFLSMKELKLLLGKVARRGQVSLAALFPGIGTIRLDADEIRTVTRSDFEMTLDEPVALRTSEGRVPVEIWLQQLDASLAATFQQRLIDMERKTQDDNWWQGCSDSQVLSIIQHIVFTGKIFTSSKSLSDTVAQSLGEMKSQLQTLIAEIRPIYGTPGKSNVVIFKMEALVMQKVATRTLLERLVLIMLQHIHILNTASQYNRFDWEDLIWKTIFRMELDGKGLKVTFFDYTKSFGFEWLPLPIPLFVSTPITERCMLNLVCALKNYTCGFLHGGSGCSKSETLKELALMFGRSVLSLTMARSTQSGWVLSALIGCLSTGTWVCFEEIHQLEPLFLNALISYLPRICEAQRTGMKELIIDQQTARVKEGFAFWAMSTQPSVKIPVRVMEYFRCVSLVQPDLAAVAEVRLYALGLANAREISRRIARVLTFLSDDCSSVFRQSTSSRLRAHSVKVVHRLINSIAHTLDNFSVTDDNYLLCNAFARVLKVGLSGEEEALFEEFLTTVFRAPHNPILAGIALASETGKMVEVMEKTALSSSKASLQVLQGFWTCISDPDRQVILLTGPPASGKSTLLKTVAVSFSQHCALSFNLHTLSGQISHRNLFDLVKACSSADRGVGFVCATESVGEPGSKFTRRDWVWIDGEKLDSDSLLAIARNEVHLDAEIRINVERSVRVIAEVETLESAVPSLLSEASVVYCSESDLSDHSIFSHELTARLPLYKCELQRLFESQYDRVMSLADDQVLSVSKRVSLLLLCNYLRLFLSPKANCRSFGVLNYILEIGAAANSGSEELPKAVVQAGWLLSLITCIGRISRNRGQFSDLIVKMSKEEDQTFAMGFAAFVGKKRTASVFDVTFSFENRTWMTWAEFADPQSDTTFVPQMPSLTRLFIDTDTTKRLKYRLSHALRTRTNFVIVGPHQCGKSLVLSHVLRDLLSKEFVALLPVQVLPTTECETLQHQVEEALDQTSPGTFGALGGRHHFAYIEDLNLDNDLIYDSLRFLSERNGWYSRGQFRKISGVSLCLIHSYSTHRYRVYPQRALRHFLLIYKYAYQDVELQAIFKGLATQPSIGSSLYNHFSRMRVEVTASERTWQHISLSNYTQALKWGRSCGSLENVMRRYFADQQVGEVKEPFCVLQELLAHGTAASGYKELTRDDCRQLAVSFESIRAACNEKYPESMKFFKDPIVHPEDQKARQLYHFSQVADDLKAGQHSIVMVERELQTVRALTYMAAEALGWKVVSTSLPDLSSELINSMAESNTNYMATDMKFALKQMLDAAVAEQKTVLLITLEEETNLNLPLLKSLFEFCCDLLCGKVLKSLTPMRRVAQTDLYPDQIKQLARERMQANIVLTILIRSDTYTFERPQSEGPLHAIKHRYRVLYNLCRMVSYDRQLAPLILRDFTRSTHIPGNLALIQDLARVTPKPLEEISLEQVLFLAHAIQRSDEAWLSEKTSKLQAALARISQCEMEMEKSSFVADIYAKCESLKRKCQELAQEKASLEATKIDASALTQEYLRRIDENRKEVKLRMDESETRLHDILETFPLKDITENLSLSSLVLLGALQTIVFPKVKPFPIDHTEKYASHCKKIIAKIGENSEKVLLELMSAEPEHFPDLSAFLLKYRELQDSASPLGDLVEAMETARKTAKDFGSKVGQWAEASLRLHLEVKIRTEMEKKANFEKIQALAQSLAVVESDCKQLEDKLLEISSMRPKLQRVLGELKDLKCVWKSQLSDLETRNSHTQGNSLLSAVFFVASLNLDYAGRERVRENTKHVLLVHKLPYSQEKQRKQGADEVPVSPFLRDSVKACELIWQLGLPYPIFYDPFSLAADLISEELMVVQYSEDLRKDSALVERITKGGSLLLLEPTEGMLQTLMPLLQYRYNMSIRLMRQGYDRSKSTVKLNTQSFEVHQDFRLYISVTVRPPLTVSQMGTVISLETADLESWKTSILLQLSKMYAGARSGATGQMSDEEVLEAIVRDASPSIFSESFQPMSRLLSQRLEDRDPPKHSSLDECPLADGIQLQVTYLELLAIASDLSSVIQALKFAEWTVSPQMFRSLLLSACQEQIREAGFPSADQIAVFTEPILYRLLVRLLWILPIKNQNVMLLCYCLKRHCEEGQYAKVIRAVAKGLTRSFTTERIELENRWEMVKSWFTVPEQLAWNSSEMQLFRFKDLYEEAKLPDTLDIKVQAVLYCWFRQDLLPAFIETLVVQVLGRRFSFIPDNDFLMASEFVTCRTPISMFFKKTYPIPWLKQAAEINQYELLHSLPIASVNRLTNKKETRLESLLSDIDAGSERKAWLVIEGLENLNKNEIERFCKHMRDMLNRKETHADFRIWLIFEVTPKDIPGWTSLLNQTYRLCFRDPKTVREHMFLAQELFDSSLFELVSSKKKQMYKDNSQLSLSTRRGSVKMTRINPILRASVNKQLKHDPNKTPSVSHGHHTISRTNSFSGSNIGTLLAGSLIESVGENELLVGNVESFFSYNLMLIVCAFRLRNAYCNDLRFDLTLKEVRSTIRQVMDVLYIDSLQVMKEQLFTLGLLFLQVIGSSWDEIEFYAGLNFIKHAIVSRSKALKFDFTDETGGWTVLRYPLYKLHANSAARSVERLLLDIPKQDHLRLIGQPNVFAREYQHKKVAKSVGMLPSVEALSDLQGTPLLQKVTDLCAIISGLLSPSAPLPPTNYESLRVTLNLQETTKYSYFFVPDRYRYCDYTTCILSNKPSFSEVLHNLEMINESLFDRFCLFLSKELERISGYMTFRTALISAEDLSMLDFISKDKTPDSWRRIGPYSLRKQSNCGEYIRSLSRPHVSFREVIDFSQVMDPLGLLTSLLRASAFLTDGDIEHIEFEVSEYSGEGLTEAQFLMDGLWLFNAQLKNEVLSDTQNSPPGRMPVLKCSAVRKHKRLRSERLCLPPGAFINYHRTAAEQRPIEVYEEKSIASLVGSAFNYIRTDWIDTGRKKSVVRPLEYRNKILCPVFPGPSATKIWMILVSDMAQGHWSKRGVKIDLP